MYALVQAATQAKGVTSLLWDYCPHVAPCVGYRLHAALSIVHRKGFEKSGHIEVLHVLVQEKVYQKQISVQKVGTRANRRTCSPRG